jgi:hypothetical protein
MNRDRQSSSLFQSDEKHFTFITNESWVSDPCNIHLVLTPSFQCIVNLMSTNKTRKLLLFIHPAPRHSGGQKNKNNLEQPD